MPRPKTPLISRGKVSSAALALIDEIGLDKLTVTAIARALGVHQASLYHHYRGLDDILDDVSRHMLRDIKVPPPDTPVIDWLVGNALAYRRVLAKHPQAAPLLAKQRPRVTREIHEFSIQRFAEIGLQRAEADVVLEAAEALIHGYSALTVAEIVDDSRWDDMTRFEFTYRTLLDALLARLAGAPTSPTPDPRGRHAGPHCRG